jgi:hypothetical protein
MIDYHLFFYMFWSLLLHLQGEPFICWKLLLLLWLHRLATLYSYLNNHVCCNVYLETLRCQVPRWNNKHRNVGERGPLMVAQWLRHCVTNRKVAGSIPDGAIGIFHWHNPSDRTMALGSTQLLTGMSTGSISWGYRRPVRKAANLTTILCRCHAIWEH